MTIFLFPDFERAVKNPRWRDAIANGQYILFTRRAYYEIGGHVSVQGEAVEDMALAMLVKREGESGYGSYLRWTTYRPGCTARWQASSRAGARTSSWAGG
jgi:hypothetical protein